MFCGRPVLRPFRVWSSPRSPQARTFGTRPQYRRFNKTSNLLYRWAASPTFYRDVGLLSAGAGGVYVWNLEEVPVSGRRRFNIISPSFEARLASSTMAQIQEEYRDQFLPDWDPRVQVVKRVLARLIPFAQGLRQGEEVAWEVHVIESPEKNAFVIPGGKVFVFTGILPLCRDEHGIAAVLGHEIAHVVAHHTAEKMSQAPFILLGCLALAMFDVSFYSSKMLFDLFMTLPGSRKQESEADYIGLMMMAQACYRPSAAADFWTRMERISKHEQVPQILSTHPSNTGREDKIREWLPKAFEVQEKAECGVTAGYMEQFGGFGNAVRRRSSDWGI